MSLKISVYLISLEELYLQITNHYSLLQIKWVNRREMFFVLKELSTKVLLLVETIKNLVI